MGVLMTWHEVPWALAPAPSGKSEPMGKGAVAPSHLQHLGTVSGTAGVSLVKDTLWRHCLLRDH